MHGPAVGGQHDWTNLVVQYRYSGGVLIGYWLYSGFQNTGGAGALGWRVKIGAQETTGQAPSSPVAAISSEWP